MLIRMTGSEDFKKVNIRGSDIESVITNFAYVAAILDGAQCETKEAIEKLLEEEVKGDGWDQEVRDFEQHMLEEVEVRASWQTGKFEECNLVCSSCGDRNAWDGVHTCCQEECKRHVNALQSFPLAAWDDISAAPLNPEMVKAARQLEIKYAEQKPVWEKIPQPHGWQGIQR